MLGRPPAGLMRVRRRSGEHAPSSNESESSSAAKTVRARPDLAFVMQSLQDLTDELTTLAAWRTAGHLGNDEEHQRQASDLLEAKLVTPPSHSPSATAVLDALRRWHELGLISDSLCEARRLAVLRAAASGMGGGDAAISSQPALSFAHNNPDKKLTVHFDDANAPNTPSPPSSSGAQTAKLLRDVFRGRCGGRMGHGHSGQNCSSPPTLSSGPSSAGHSSSGLLGRTASHRSRAWPLPKADVTKPAPGGGGGEGAATTEMQLAPEPAPLPGPYLRCPLREVSGATPADQRCGASSTTNGASRASASPPLAQPAQRSPLPRSEAGGGSPSWTSARQATDSPPLSSGRHHASWRETSTIDDLTADLLDLDATLNVIRRDTDSKSRAKRKAKSVGGRSELQLARTNESFAASYRRQVHATDRPCAACRARGLPVFDPDHRLLTCWHIVVFAFVVTSAVVVPLMVAFETELPKQTQQSLAYMDYVFDCAFIIDILISTNVAYFRDGFLVKSRRLIAQKYLRTWFILDFVSSFPLSWFLQDGASVSDAGSASGAEITKVNKLLRLVKLGKLVRILKLFKIFDKLAQDARFVCTLPRPRPHTRAPPAPPTTTPPPRGPRTSSSPPPDPSERGAARLV